MKPFPHRYNVRLVSGPSGYAELTTAGTPPLQSALPPQFDGPGDAWSPEHLLLASVQACFLFTLRAVTRHAKVEFHTADIDATGTVDESGGVTRFSEIVLRPTITVDASTSRDLVLRLLARTEHSCLVSASLSTPVRLEPTIVTVPAKADMTPESNDADGIDARRIAS